MAAPVDNPELIPELNEFLSEWVDELATARAGESPENYGARLYQEACQAEFNGDFVRAIELYRRAFKLNPRLEEKAYLNAVDSSMEPIRDNPLSPSNLERDHHHDMTSYPGIDVHGNVTDELRLYIAGDFDGVELPPLVKRKAAAVGSHMSDLSVELILHILQLCSEVDVERMGLTCKFMLNLSRDGSVWKDRVLLRVSREEAATRGASLQWNWRQVYLTIPRIYSDGLYICKSTYLRQGGQDINLWYASVIQVNYWRYFRFLPDGTCKVLISPAHPRKTAVSMASNNPQCDTGTWDIVEDYLRARVDGGRQELLFTFKVSNSKKTRGSRLTLTAYTGTMKTNGDVVDMMALNKMNEDSGKFHFISFNDLSKIVDAHGE